MRRTIILHSLALTIACAESSPPGDQNGHVETEQPAVVKAPPASEEPEKASAPTPSDPEPVSIDTLPVTASPHRLPHPGERPTGYTSSLKWYSNAGQSTSLFEQKKLMRVTSAQVLAALGRKPFELPPNWRERLPHPIENALAQRHVDPASLHRQPKDETYALVLGFDVKFAHIAVVKNAGSHLWHHYNAVEANLLVKRSAEVDEVFFIKRAEERIGGSYLGVSQGAAANAVHEALGPPDATRHNQARGMFSEYYFRHDRVVYYERSRVTRLQTGVPNHIRKREYQDSLIDYRSR